MQSITQGRTESAWAPGSEPEDPRNTWVCVTWDSEQWSRKIPWLDHCGWLKLEQTWKSGRACDQWSWWLSVFPSSLHRLHETDLALTQLSVVVIKCVWLQNWDMRPMKFIKPNTVSNQVKVKHVVFLYSLLIYYGFVCILPKESNRPNYFSFSDINIFSFFLDSKGLLYTVVPEPWYKEWLAHSKLLFLIKESHLCHLELKYNNTSQRHSIIIWMVSLKKSRNV